MESTRLRENLLYEERVLMKRLVLILSVLVLAGLACGRSSDGEGAEDSGLQIVSTAASGEEAGEEKKGSGEETQDDETSDPPQKQVEALPTEQQAEEATSAPTVEVNPTATKDAQQPTAISDTGELIPNLLAEGVRLEDYTMFDDQGGRTIFVGILKNTSGGPLGDSKILFLLTNEDGDEVYADFTYSDFKFTSDEGNDYFDFSILEGLPPEAEALQILVETRRPLSSESYHRNFTVVSAEGEINSSGGYVIRGEVMNVDADLARGVFIYAALYDQEGRYIGTGFTLVNEGDIPANESGTFELVTYRYHGEIDHFELSLQGYRPQE
jgi:hypothetical protein